ncbi:MAG: DNA-processing protein DprA [Micrococcaceae bacterium]
MNRTLDGDPIRIARAGLSQVIEPADTYGALVVQRWGPVKTLDIILEREHPSSGEWQALGEHSGQFRSALERWKRKRAYVNPGRALETMESLGGGLLIPEDPQWPAALDDLGPQKPLGLWWLGRLELPPLSNVVAVVGSREATNYGTHVTTRFVDWLVDKGYCVASGGAYGIDAAAHHAALSRGDARTIPTIAVLAGGLDQFYPAGNHRLIGQIAHQGAVLSELPPGYRPNRYRFLHRNRLLAALAVSTLIVEARWRSGAQNTAGHALGLGREVGVVPGPIDSAASSGCHRLLRESPASLIASESDLGELVGWAQASAALTEDESGDSISETALDGLHDDARVVLEALPVRTGTSVDKICSITGHPAGEVLRHLVRLQRAGRIEKIASGWRKVLV